MVIIRYIFCLSFLLLYCVDLTWSESFFKTGSPKLLEAKNLAADSAYPRFDMLAKVLSPSVVNISVESESGEEKEKQVLPFFKDPPKGSGRMRSLGSGFILSESGYVATNYHVIDKAKRIIVRLLDDKAEYEAKLIGKDEKTDLALLKIKPKRSLTPVFIGDSDQLEVGEWAMAIGNQFQLGQTVTVGIISAKSRRVPARVSGPYDDFIQTDASINPGSSGGPLFNTKGQVIGINTAIFSPGRSQFGGTGFNIGIGFAIPINMARDVLTQLKQKGKVTRGMLGVVIQSIDSKLAKALGREEDQGGALVADVVPGSPAAAAGFKIKDIIVSFGGQAVEEHNDLPLMVARTRVGTEVQVGVIRAGRSVSLRPVIRELTSSSFPKTSAPEKPVTNEIGIAVQDVTKDIAASLGFTEVKGVIVTAVEPQSAANIAGIVRGDVIEELDNRPVLNKEALSTILKSVKKNMPILLLLRRKEGTRFLTITIK